MEGARAAAESLLALIAEARGRAVQDPFGNPVLAAALAISRQIDDRALDEAKLAAIVALLRDDAAADRARRLAAYVGGADPAENRGHVGPACGKARAARSRGQPAAAAHVARAGGAAALWPACSPRTRPSRSHPRPTPHWRTPPSTAVRCRRVRPHRPEKPTLEQEFAAATVAMQCGRDAIDRVCGAILDAASGAFPQAWSGLNPAPVILASWVGLDTDGRTDIGWWDSIALRLRMKRLGLARLLADVEGVAAAATLAGRLRDALEAVDGQIALAPAGPEPDAVEPFARALIAGRERALLSPEPAAAVVCRGPRRRG